MRKSLLSLVLGVCLLLAAGCGQFGSKTEQASKNEDQIKAEEVEVVIPVEAELPTRGNISSHFETTSRVMAENRVQVLAEGVGECISLNAEEGDRVQAGQVLAQLDPTEIKATIGQTEVQVRQSKTSYDIAEKSLTQGIGSKAERDNARFAHEQALAALEMQKVQLEKLTVKAPISGVITMRNVQLGQMVAGGAPLFSIVDPASFMLTISVPERELARLKEGQIAKVTIDALGADEFDAAVRRINPGVDPISGTVKVTLDFDEATRDRLRDSAFARVRLVMETHENALLLAKDTVVEENARKYVFVIEQPETPAEPAPETQSDESAPEPSSDESAAKEEAKTDVTAGPADSNATESEPAEASFVANRIEVETGLEDSKSVEIVSGIDDGSLVVTLGQHTLKPGARVRVTNATTEIMAKAGLSAEKALEEARKKRAGGEGPGTGDTRSGPRRRPH